MERAHTNQEESLQYYNSRVENISDVLSLRPGTGATADDLHAFTGYDYLSLAQWDAYINTVLLSRLTLPKNPKVFEGGCGAGAVLDTIKRRLPDAEVSGFDYTEALVKIAQERVSSSIAVGDITSATLLEDLSLTEESFDLVISHGVFLHLNSVEDSTAAARNLFRLVKPGGTMFVGYLTDASNEAGAEKSRGQSERAKQMTELLGVVPGYTYTPKAIFEDLVSGGQGTLEFADNITLLEPVECLHPIHRSLTTRYNVYVRHS